MIEALRFRNFKGLRELSLALERFTVFVGPNGSGKTTMLEGVYFLSRSIAVNPFAFFSEDRAFSQLRTRQATDLVVLGCEVRGHGLQVTAYEPKNPPFELWGIEVEVRVDKPGTEWQPIAQSPSKQRPAFSAIFLQLNPKRLAAPSYIHNLRPQLASDGHGLASVLAFLSMN